MSDTLMLSLMNAEQDVISKGTPQQFLQKLCATYELSHVTYLCTNMPASSDPAPYIISTYTPQWIDRYKSRSYVDIDPVIRGGLQGVMPIDWEALPHRRRKKVRIFFDEAREYGVGRQGLSFPIRGRHGETAIFSMNSHANSRDWKDLKQACMRDFQVLAFHFHTRVLEWNGIEKFEPPKLTPRELECLKWAAEGKTIWETSIILGISQSTVRFFLENIRHKLDAANTIHAVAKALRLGLI